MTFTLETAPDYASRLALCRPVRRLTEGAAPGTDLASAVHANFARVIEQNFASASAASVAQWLDTVEPRSLGALAQAYVNATEMHGRGAVALAILAHRLDPARLAQLAPHFGHARLHAAVLKAAPHKLDAFNAHADVKCCGPVPGDLNLHRPETQAAAAQERHGLMFIDYSLEEIYLAFRTARIGATSALASMFQTGLVLGAALRQAGAGGLWAERYCALGSQLCPPAAWAATAGQLHAWLHAFEWPGAAPLAPADVLNAPNGHGLGRLQRQGFFDVFQLDASLHDDFAVAGGDHLSTGEWARSTAGVPCTADPTAACPVC